MLFPYWAVGLQHAAYTTETRIEYVIGYINFVK